MISLQVTPKPETGKALEAEVDVTISQFETWFIGKLGDQPLSGPEKAILKTFLWWMHNEQQNAT